MGLNYLTQQVNYKLVDILNNGVPQESLTVPSAKEKSDVLTLIAQYYPVEHITNIKTVKNSFLEAMFLIKKEEMRSRYGQVQELQLIHVTGAANVKSICSDNFDWRRVKRGKFGNGVSFSPDAEYANRYANYNIGEDRAFIITKVLVARTTLQTFQNKVAPIGFDTVTGYNKKVYVKFYDHDVLPLYVAYYLCTNLREIIQSRKANVRSVSPHNHRTKSAKTSSKPERTRPTTQNRQSNNLIVPQNHGPQRVITDTGYGRTIVHNPGLQRPSAETGGTVPYHSSQGIIDDIWYGGIHNHVQTLPTRDTRHVEIPQPSYAERSVNEEETRRENGCCTIL